MKTFLMSTKANSYAARTLIRIHVPISRNLRNKYKKCIGFSLTDAADILGGIQANITYINEK